MADQSRPEQQKFDPDPSLEWAKSAPSNVFLLEVLRFKHSPQNINSMVSHINRKKNFQKTWIFQNTNDEC